MKKTLLEKYASMVSKSLKKLTKLNKLPISAETTNLIICERRSLKDLLTNSYYKKLIKAELKLLKNQYIKIPTMIDSGGDSERRIYKKM